MPEDKEGVVSRWSRRKQEVAEEEIKAQKSQSRENNSQKNKETKELEEEKSPEQLKAEKLAALNKLTDADMPDLDSLDESSDFSVFMSTSVSEGLRKMALKKLFMGKSYNIRDGLDEYDGDYTKFEKMPSSLVTSDMKHMIEVEAKKQLAKEQEEERQRQIAAGELEGFDEMTETEEFDEFVEDNVEVSTTDEEYIDQHINVEGFDTRVADKDINHHLTTEKDHEELA